MSLPSFPENGLHLTKEEVFHMLLGSIAMEEMALSHIINAEGEKLQYILGTLPGAQKACATPQEILQVNKSISELLGKVSENQILLKGKLAQVLEAMEIFYPSVKEKAFCIFNAPTYFVWKCGSPLLLIPIHGSNDNCFWKKKYPYHIFLPDNELILLNYTFTLCCTPPSPVTIALEVLKDGHWQDIFVCKSQDCGTSLTISGNTILSTKGYTQACLLFCLKNPQQVTVQQVSLSFIAL